VSIRRAVAADVPAITAIVQEAYAPYIPRIGRKPAPMLDDYAAQVRDGVAWVLDADGSVAGVVVLLDQPDHLLIHNVAVGSRHRGIGAGRDLLRFAEAEAARRGFAEVRLYTNETMLENIALYGRIGYVETGRGGQSGFRRVFFRKALAGGGAAK
jgi:ribosomal protein S18 acetylase RimI-like enzyme